MQPSDSTYHLPPFPAFPCTSRYVPLGSVHDALARICRSIDASEAISLVIGPPGTGKSLLCGLIAQRYQASHDVVVLGETRLEDRNAFLRHLLHHLQVDMSRVRDGDLQLAVIERVCGGESAEGGLLIVVDEAQSLSTDVLEAIRMVTNIMRRGVPRVSAVVCGGVKLDDVLVEASMESFTQRVATRCYLHPLNGEETKKYILDTIRQCGADPSGTINDAAIKTIHHACSGVPRLINQLMTQAIDCAEEADQVMITERVIDIAWSQLQQLPSPMVEEPRMTRESTSVEFGELDDSDSFLGIPETGRERPVNPTPGQDLGDLDDIVVEGASELWLDEQAEELPPETDAVVLESSDDRDNASDPESVFGDFESEEDIKVGTPMTRQQAQAAAPPANLESALHQEIVGLNHYLAELLDQPIETNSIVDAEESLDDTPFEGSDPEEVSEEFINLADEEPNAVEDLSERPAPQQSALVKGGSLSEHDRREDGGQPEESNPSPSLYWISDEKTETESDSNSKSIRRDDSDLLVIEDEIEVRRVDAAKQYDSLDQTISVDFQAMLSRMRSGSNP